VPRWFIEYIMFHEMLHSVVPDEIAPDGRRRVHTRNFTGAKSSFPGYRARAAGKKRISSAFCAEAQQRALAALSLHHPWPRLIR
jgi:hypothetical protein